MKRIDALTRSPEETRVLGEAIGRRLDGGELILLSGPLGAGKTTLVQGLARGLGIWTPIQSPSFVLERLHQGRLLLRHLDFYRLGSSDIDESGFLDSGGDQDVTVIEWAERAGYVPGAALRIEMKPDADEPLHRSIIVEALTPLWDERIEDVQRQLGAAR